MSKITAGEETSQEQKSDPQLTIKLTGGRDDWKQSRSEGKNTLIQQTRLIYLLIKSKQIISEVNLDIKPNKTKEESILLPRPRALADSQVYLAILVTISCPFYVPMRLSAAITLLSHPCIFGGGGH